MFRSQQSLRSDLKPDGVNEKKKIILLTDLAEPRGDLGSDRDRLCLSASF